LERLHVVDQKALEVLEREKALTPDPLLAQGLLLNPLITVSLTGSYSRSRKVYGRVFSTHSTSGVLTFEMVSCNVKKTITS
jgi:hypothetical protein